MSGILDPKSRVMDVLLTEEGRRQVAAGTIRIEYASFSDSSTFYEVDILSGSSDTSDRLFFECFSSPYDQITFETDDSGLLHPLKNTSVPVANGLILTGSGQFVTGTSFIDSANELLSASLDAFRNNFIIGTIDPLFERDSFGVGQKFLHFKIANDNPIAANALFAANISTLDSIFQDERMSHLPNFMYLPPINKPKDITTIDFEDKNFVEFYKIANYENISSVKPKEDVLKRLKDRLTKLEANGNLKTIKFDPTSNSNNIHCQLFELSNNQVKKLDIVDFGLVRLKDDGTNQRVLFAGKVFVDDFGTHTFVNVFTMYFE